MVTSIIGQIMDTAPLVPLQLDQPIASMIELEKQGIASCSMHGADDLVMFLCESEQIQSEPDSDRERGQVDLFWQKITDRSASDGDNCAPQGAELDLQTTDAEIKCLRNFGFEAVTVWQPDVYEEHQKLMDVSTVASDGVTLVYRDDLDSSKMWLQYLELIEGAEDRLESSELDEVIKLELHFL